MEKKMAADSGEFLRCLNCMKRVVKLPISSFDMLALESITIAGYKWFTAVKTDLLAVSVNNKCILRSRDESTCTRVVQCKGCRKALGFKLVTNSTYYAEDIPCFQSEEKYLLTGNKVVVEFRKMMWYGDTFSRFYWFLHEDSSSTSSENNIMEDSQSSITPLVPPDSIGSDVYSEEVGLALFQLYVAWQIWDSCEPFLHQTQFPSEEEEESSSTSANSTPAQPESEADSVILMWYFLYLLNSCSDSGSDTEEAESSDSQLSD